MFVQPNCRPRNPSATMRARCRPVRLLQYIFKTAISSLVVARPIVASGKGQNVGFSEVRSVYAFGTKRTSRPDQPMSAIGGIADMGDGVGDMSLTTHIRHDGRHGIHHT